MDRKKGFETNQVVELGKQKSQLKRPALYQVYILNDDYTPMDFVVNILMQFFCMDEPTATQVMLKVHHQGKGICGLFTHDIAETKVKQVNDYAKQCEYPLLCEMEKCEA